MDAMTGLLGWPTVTASIRGAADVETP